MTDATSTPHPTGVRLTGTDGGVEFELNLDRSALLPGQLAGGTVRHVFQRGMEFRGIVASLIATEQWQWQRTDRDANGTTTTHTVTETRELQRQPNRHEGPGSHAAGETRDFRLELRMTRIPRGSCGR
jgi:hypothetical protein